MNLNQKESFFKRTVLVVDDEPVNRHLLGAILEQEYDVVYASNGLEAMERIRSFGDLLSIILLDILMPEMSGFEVLEQLKSDKLLSEIPVIVLTSEKSAEIQSLQMGAADFLSKPYDLPEVILARVSHSIKLFEDSKIIQATEYDKLTGLYTSEFFFEYVNQYDNYHKDAVSDALVIDFSRFGLINELRGRKFGDDVLKAIADGLRAVTIEQGGFACRYDGDIFYLYINHTENYSHILAVIKNQLSGLLKDTEIRIRMGVYTDEKRESSVLQRFDRARQVCNTLRNQFTTSYALYTQQMHEKDVFEAQLLDSFEAALKEKQFKVYYQPKYNIQGESPALTSAEALIRWIHPTLGFIRPDLFIPLFEENGLIQKLDRYVWNEVAVQMKEWREKFGRAVPISVNISRIDMNDPEMTDFIVKIVTENGINPHDYLLEVTESAYTDNSQHIVEIVNGLREKGFRVEMDDFGSGYSSLNMLTALPIDALKVDRAFINDIAPGNKEMRMVELILDIAKFLEVLVVAEGVETKEQCDMLKAAGCDIIQGFYFSKPVPPEEFEELIQKG